MPCRRLVMPILLAALVVACDDGVGLIEGTEKIEGSGDVITESRDVSGFDRVVLAGEGRVVITVGASESLTIEADDNLMQYLETTVSGGALEIATSEGVDVDPSRGIVYRVGVAELTGVELLGGGAFEVDRVEADTFDVLLAGGGEISIDNLSAADLSVELLGGGDITLSGIVDVQSVVVAGAGGYNAGKLESSIANVDIPGSGEVTVWAVDELDVSITGVGSVDFFGNPVVGQQVTGTGSVTALGEK